MNAKQRMNGRILNHGENLKTIFNLDGDAVKIAKQVHSLEVKAAKIALDYCNGDIDGDKIDTEGGKIMAKLDKIVNFSGNAIPVFFNRDPRGYALKIDDEYVRTNSLGIHRDWGGYGILAPEFNGKV